MDYDASAGLLEDYKSRVSILKWSASVSAEAYAFSESEMNLLDATFKTIESAINSAEISLEYYKQVLGVYRDL
jgi:hypothetical protein